MGEEERAAAAGSASLTSFGFLTWQPEQRQATPADSTTSNERLRLREERISSGLEDG